MTLPVSFLPPYLGNADPFEAWQPLGVPGFILDINPRYHTTVDGFGNVSSIKSTVGGRNDDFANTNPSLRPAYEAKGWVGSKYTRPSLLFNGISSYLTCASNLAATLGGGNDTPFTLFMGAQFTSIPGANAVLLGLFRSSDLSPIWDFFSSSGSTYATNKRGDSGSSVVVSGGTPDTLKRIFEAVQHGTSVDMRADGSSLASGSQDTVSVTYDTVSVGASFASSSPANLAPVRVGRILGFTGALGTSDLTKVRSLLTQAYL